MDLIDSQLLYLQNKKNNSKNWNISWNLGVFLSNLIDIKSPKCVLEVGTSNGFSTLFIAKSLNPTSIIYTVDINEERLKDAKQSFNLCNLKNIYPICDDIEKVLQNFKFKEKIDFLFLDALQKDYLKLIKIALQKKLLTNDCLIVCDNILSGSKMNDFLKYMRLNFECEFVDIDSGFLVAKNKN